MERSPEVEFSVELIREFLHQLSLSSASANERQGALIDLARYATALVSQVNPGEGVQ